MFAFIAAMSFTDKEMLEEVSNFDTRTVALYIFILFTSVGIIFGFISSLLFFFSMNNKKMKTLNGGILFNILAWIFSSISLLIFMIFLTFVR